MSKDKDSKNFDPLDIDPPDNLVDQLLASHQYYIFAPTKKMNLLADYPELLKYDAFGRVSQRQLVYVWCYACKGSPAVIRGLDESEKQRFAFNMAYDGAERTDEAKKMLSGKYDDNVRLAIMEMGRFELGPRVKARLLAEISLSNISAALGSDNSTILGNPLVKPSDKKAILEMIDKGADIIEKLNRVFEGGSYGVVRSDEFEFKEGEIQELIHGAGEVSPD